MDASIAETECLAIFVYDSSKINAKRVHWRAMLPYEGERSFFRIDVLGKAEIGAIGEGEAARNRDNQTLHGWGEVAAKVINDNPPLVMERAEPPEGHGVIVAWPDEIQDKNKLAMAIASKARPVLWP